MTINMTDSKTAPRLTYRAKGLAAFLTIATFASGLPGAATAFEIDTDAPVITRDEILIAAPIERVWAVQTAINAWPRWRPTVPRATLLGPLAAGSVFHWEEGGLVIASTIREIAPMRRIVWTGPAQGIDAVHVWEFTPVSGGTLVHTEESWNGPAVHGAAAQLQPVLDGALKDWLNRLKSESEKTSG